MKKLCMVLSLALVAALCMVCLTACGYSGDPQKDKETLEGKGYSVILNTVAVGDTEATLIATKDNSKEVFENLTDMLDEEKVAKLKFETVSIAYYKDADAAKAAFDKLSDNDKKGAKVSRSGKMIIAEATFTGKEALDSLND